jgi:hypothetical protein
MQPWFSTPQGARALHGPLLWALCFAAAKMQQCFCGRARKEQSQAAMQLDTLAIPILDAS